MISKPNKQTSPLIKYMMKAPIRVLARARDFYVKSLTGCGTNMAYGNAMGCPTPQMPAVQRSFSVNSSNVRFRTVDEDLPELIRKEHLPRSRSTPAVVSGTASTVVFGRIDEEREVDGFGDEDDDGVGLLDDNNNNNNNNNKVYARSKSYAVVSAKVV